MISCPTDPAAVTGGIAVTDPAGLTPPRTSNQAPIVTLRKLQATDTPARPAVTEYRYQLTVYVSGRLRYEEPVSAQALSDKTFTVQLVRQQPD